MIQIHDERQHAAQVKEHLERAQREIEAERRQAERAVKAAKPPGLEAAEIEAKRTADEVRRIAELDRKAKGRAAEGD